MLKIKKLNYGKLSSKLPTMTLILGARCIDGVVLIADRKITKTNEIGSISFEYKNKLHGELSHVIFGISGSTETFGYFVNEIKDRIRKGDIILENVTNIIADKVLEINDKRHFYRETRFDLLTAVQYPNKPSTLTYISVYGGIDKISTYHTIGIGSVFAKPFLQNIWNSSLKMSTFAALGWFIIQYIEDYQLHSSVGLGKDYPQIWFIPDNENIDYEVNPETKPKEFNEIKKNVNKNFRLYHKQLQKLFHVP